MPNEKNNYIFEHVDAERHDAGDETEESEGHERSQRHHHL
jgi:hypothetical protein